MASSNHLRATGVALVSALTLALSGCADPASIEREEVPASPGKENAAAISVIGQRFKVDFGAPYIFALDFQSETQMSFTQVDVTGTTLENALAGTVQITRVEIRPNVYMVYWSEPFNNDTNVTHVQDFERGWVWTNISTPGQPFVNLNGPLTPMDSE
ncbi:MAG: MoaF N-terminal domain-containing protein [Pseudomonadota bacterium]